MGQGDRTQDMGSYSIRKTYVAPQAVRLGGKGVVHCGGKPAAQKVSVGPSLALQMARHKG